MKQILFMLPVLAVIYSGVASASILRGVSRSVQRTTSVTGSEAITQANLVASGLTCSMCSNAIFKALSKLDFVAKVSPDVEHSSFLISFRSGSPIVLDDLQKAVRGAGFSVDTLTLFLNLNGVNVQNDTHTVIDGIVFHFVDVPARQLKGAVSVRVIDKDFLPDREYKHYGTFTQMSCYKTGKAFASCCHPGVPVSTGTRIYHVTL